MPHSRRLKIYQSRTHLLITLLFVVIPFIFLLFFSRFANISIDKLLADFATSFYRIIVAYVIATPLGWILAVSFYWEKVGRHW